MGKLYERQEKNTSSFEVSNNQTTQQEPSETRQERVPFHSANRQKLQSLANRYGDTIFTNQKTTNKPINNTQENTLNTNLSTVQMTKDQSAQLELTTGEEQNSSTVCQLAKQNAIASGLGECFGEPIDVVTGAFLITTTDFILPNSSKDFYLKRNYNSTNQVEGIFGKGWSFPYEGKLYQEPSGNRLYVTIDTGHTLLFTWDGNNAVNITRGHFWYDLKKEREHWKLLDRKKHTTYYYNEQGLLLSIADNNHQKIQFHYTENNLTDITMPFGYHLEVTMQEGKIIQLKDELGRTMQYRYNNGLLSDIIDMDGGIIHYDYDNHGFLAKAIDQEHVTYLENKYDDKGRVLLQTLANGDSYHAEYKEKEREVIIFNSVTNQTVLYTYNEYGEVLSVCYEDNTKTEYTYDEAGNRITKIDRLGNKKRWEYDTCNRITKEYYPAGLIVTYEYNTEDDLICTSDNAKRKTTYTYDQHHNLCSITEKTETEPAISHYFYDDIGRLIKEIDPNGNQTAYHYKEGCGKPSVITYANGEEVHFEYDIANRKIAQEDTCGRIEYHYNARNKQTIVRDGEGNETHWRYDEVGRLSAMYPPKAWKTQQGETKYSYDFLDRLIDTTYPDGAHERQIRDGEGKIKKNFHPNAYNIQTENGEGITYEYDSDGNNIRIHYPDGGCERMFYDAEGNRIKHILPESYHITTDNGEGWTYAYDAEHRLQTITGPDGVCLASYRYDLAGNVIEETDAQGNTTYRKYTLHGQLAEVLKPVKKMTPLLVEAFRIENKHASNILKHSPQVTKENRSEIVYEKTTYTYDKNNNLIQEYHHSGYWNKHGILQEKDGIDLIITFTYDKRNRRIGVEDNTGAVTRFQYDVQGKLIYEEKAISKEIHQIIQYQYDKAGHLIEKKEQLASGLPTNNDEPKFAITRYQYDENGNRIELITPEGYHIYRTYDVCDRLSSERVVDKQNGIDRIVCVSYDLAGNITKVTRQGKGCEAWELQYDYDFKDRITHVKDCLGPIFTYTYNKNDWLTTELLPQTTTTIEQESIKNQNTYHYNCYGQVIQTVDGTGIVQKQNQYFPNGTLASTQNADGTTIEYSYGIHGLQTKLHTARSKTTKTPAQTLTYDSRGRITGILDGNQNQTNYTIDSWGRIQTVHHPDGSKETYTYNFAGHITTTTDANGGTITYRYNSQGNVCEIIDQEGNSETFHYDKEGRMILHIDRNGNQVKTTYNVDGNPVLECACDNKGKQEITRSFEYDANGNIKKAIAGGFCYTYQYRPDGKLLQKQSSGKTVLACTYYNDGSLESLTDISGKTIYYHYDWQGKLSEIQDKTGQSLVQYTHTLGGKLKEIHHKNGMSTLYDYDTEGNIVHLRLENKEGEIISDFHYEYDGNGNRILKTGTFTEKTGLKQSNISYCYDKKNQLIKESQDGESISYHYDLCGNRLKKVDKNGTERYTYNRKNQLLHQDSNQEDTTYEYDLQGNILKTTGTNGITTYSYNAFNQQTMISMPNGNTLENYYDAEYLRAKTIENGTAKSFLYYNGELLAESKADTEHTLINQYILGYGVTVGWNPETKEYYSYHLDEQNSTAYITDEAGAIQNSYQYGAFGDIRQKQENIHNRILYTGQQYDQVSEQYYLRARFYNPIVGRFLQEDVYRGAGLNLYAYCANNPVMYYDPSGYSPKRAMNCKHTDSSDNIPVSRTNWGPEHGKGNTKHNNAIEDELDRASQDGATDLRKNKVQVDVNGTRVFGKNGKFTRPDASYVLNQKRHNTNYVSNSNDIAREQEVFNLMKEADPNAINTLITNY